MALRHGPLPDFVARAEAISRRSAFRVRLRKLMRFAYPALVVLAALSALASGFFYDKLRDSERILKGFVMESTHGISLADTDLVAMTLSREVFRRTSHFVPPESLSLYDRLESASFFNVSTSVSLQHGIFGVIGERQLGPCGTMSRVMVRSLEKVHIASRKLQLLPDANGQGGGHTMIEYRSNGRWIVLSPSDSSFVWYTHDGRLATVADIQKDSTVFAQIFQRDPDYPYRFSNVSHIRWAKIPPIARSFFHRLLGDQAYRDAVTPYLYDRPRLLLFYGSLAAFAFFSVLALLTRGASRRVQRARAAAVAPAAA